VPHGKARRLLKHPPSGTFSKGWIMLSTYLVAVFAISFSAMVALTWIYTASHVDPPSDAERPASSSKGAMAA
jgi:hypothetical protein